MNRDSIIESLQTKIQAGSHIFGVTAGNGLVTKSAVNGGVDLILALNSARFRQMGRSSLADHSGKS